MRLVIRWHQIGPNIPQLNEIFVLKTKKTKKHSNQTNFVPFMYIPADFMHFVSIFSDKLTGAVFISVCAPDINKYIPLQSNYMYLYRFF